MSSVLSPTVTHHVLPAAAQRELQLAAQTPITARDPLARQKAIEKVTQRIKSENPQLFKE